MFIFVVETALGQSTGTIRGQVTEASSGDPLVGAAIIIEGTERGAATDRDGRYRLPRVAAGTQTVTVSYLGYEDQSETVTVTSGESTTQNFALRPATLTPGEVVVLGVRMQGQAEALSRQMNASHISNVIAADLMGRFPDPSAPEAVRRLPGVSVQRDMGEARYVQIRGGSPQMTQVTFNGEQVPPPEGDDRQVALDAVPVDILESIEVSKAITPAMDAEAIGGSVNLETKRAPDDRLFSVEASGGYNEIREKPLYNGSVTFGNRIADGKFGYLLSGSYTRRDFGSDSFEPSYDLGGPGPSDDRLDEMEVRSYSLWRSRAGAIASLDYRFSSSSSVYLTGIYSEMVDNEQRRVVHHDLSDGDVQPDGSVLGGTLGFDHKSRREDQQSINITAGGEHALENGIQVDYHGTFTRSLQDTPNDAEVFFIREGVDFNPDFSDPKNVRSNPAQDIRSGTYMFDALEPGVSLAKNTDYVGALNVAIPYRLGTGGVGEFALGGKVRQRNAVQNVEETEWEPADGASDIILGQDVGDLEFDNQGYNAGNYPFPPVITEENEVDTFLDQFRSSLDGGKNLEGDAEDYDLKERVTAVYAMTEVNLTQKLMVLPGVRYELTQLDVQGFDFDPDTETLTPTRDESTYSQFFPMLHIRYRFTPRTNLRLALTRTLARPNFFELVPYRIRDDEDLEIGNPDLLPTTAMNYDLMFEHYHRLIGIMSAGVYYKRLVDPIFTFVEQNDLGGETEQKRNGESAMIMGLEVALHRQLRFLPAPLDGLGIFANYTYTDSESTLPGGLTAPMPGQADHVFNAALSYEKSGFSGQISTSFLSDHVDEYGGETEAVTAREADEYIGSHLQLDLSASYRVAPTVQVFAEVLNLTNEPFTLYQGIPERPIQYEWYERWARIGLRYSL